MRYNAILANNVESELSVDPVSVDDFKVFAKIDYTEEDVIIERILKASREVLEQKYNIDIVLKTRSVVANNSCGMIQLPGNNIQDVTNADNVTLDVVGDKLVSPRSCNVSISYKSGYDVPDCPEYFKLAIMQQALYWFTNRGDMVTNPNHLCPEAVSIMNVYSKNTKSWFL